METWNDVKIKRREWLELKDGEVKQQCWIIISVSGMIDASFNQQTELDCCKEIRNYWHPGRIFGSPLPL